MSAQQKALVAFLVFAAFVLLVLAGWAAGKTSLGAFFGAMLAGVVFEVAQRWDRRLRRQ